jgi:H+-transporting ATPase
VFATLSLMFTFSLYWWVRTTQGLSPAQLQTVVFLILVFTNQAGIYALRSDGPCWRLAPGRLMLLASLGDLALVSVLGTMGWLMAPLPVGMVAGVLGACAAFALVLDQAKLVVFPRFSIL